MSNDELKNQDEQVELPAEPTSTQSLMDKQDIAIFNSSVIYYGQIYSGMSPAEQVARLTADDRHIQLLIKDAARHLQVLKIRQQAIRKRKADVSTDISLADLEQARRSDEAFDANLQAFHTLAGDAIGKVKRNPLATKLDKLGLKDAILSGSLDEAIAKVKAAKQAKESDTEKVEQTEKEKKESE